MYRIIVKSGGIYGNALCSTKYCFFKYSAIQLVKMYQTFECNFTVEKLKWIYKDVFSWSPYLIEIMSEV